MPRHNDIRFVTLCEIGPVRFGRFGEVPIRIVSRPMTLFEVIVESSNFFLID